MCSCAQEGPEWSQTPVPRSLGCESRDVDYYFFAALLTTCLRWIWSIKLVLLEMAVLGFLMCCLALPSLGSATQQLQA